MPIQTENIKLMASQRLTDRDDGGGRITGIEIVDGNVNTLFPDISRLDRVYGRVSLRKGFVAVQTNDNETYSGAHVILSKPAADPKVSVCMFSTGDPNDERTKAQDRVESYVTVGPRYQGWLWGDHPAGSRSLLLFCVKGVLSPDIGSVFCLFQNKGLVNEVKQYVRVTKVEATKAEFNATATSTEYGATAMAFARDILKIEIGDPLRTTFTGAEITKNDSLSTNVYTTTVSDAAKYYGVMLPTFPIEAGDISINVDSIYTHLVPSAQGELPMADLSVGEAGPVVGVGASYTFAIPGYTVVNAAQVYFGRGIKPGSLTLLTGAGHTYTDNSNGILVEGTSQVGTVDYSGGGVTFTNVVGSYGCTLTVTAVVGVEIPMVPNARYTSVKIANRGYNFTAILDPLPVPGSIVVDYMAQGKWYRLRDNGIGGLIPDIAATGSGTVNYATGNIILTCGALPDVDTAIIYNWANPTESADMSGEVPITVAEVTHTLPYHPVAPGSFSMTWPVAASVTVTATDDGNGYLTGGATGWINYATGAFAFRPTQLPVSGGEYSVDYEKYTKIEGNASAAGTGFCTITLPSSPIKPGTVVINAVVMFGSYQHVYALHDDGVGNLFASGWRLEFPISHPTWPGYSGGNSVTGTIDYTTGICVINLTNVAGEEKYSEPYEYQLCPAASTALPTTFTTPAVLPPPILSGGLSVSGTYASGTGEARH